jgi:uracil-DNA glycosylase family 4
LGIVELPELKVVGDCDGCKGCPIREQYPSNFFVPPHMGDSLRAAVGEMPGERESESGDVFAGSSGTWTNILYKNIGIKRNDVSYINLIQCRPPADVFPTEKKGRQILGDSNAYRAVEHCKKTYVQPFLESRPWERVDIYGEHALRSLTGKAGLDTYRGSPLPITSMGSEIRTVPTYDAERIRKDQTMLPVVINDLRRSLFVDPERYNIFPTLDDVKNFKAKHFAFDLETNRWNRNEIYMIGFSAGPYEAMVVPYSPEYLDEIKRIFWEAESVVGQNLIQFDLPVLRANGVNVRGPKDCMVWDIMLMHHLRFPKFPHRLEFIGSQFTNKGAWKNDKASFETYCARDVDVTWRSFEVLKRLLDEANLTDIYKYVSWPLGRIAAHITARGFKQSAKRLKDLRVEYLKNIEAEQNNLPEELRTKFVTKRKRIPAPPGTLGANGKPLKFVYEDVEEKINPWKSSEVKRAWLYGKDKFDLPVQYKIGTQNITGDKTALDRLYNRLINPSQALLAKYGEARIVEMAKVIRSLKKLNAWATRLSGFAKNLKLPDEIIHPSFNVHGTTTGRFSSSDPNAQNIPEEARFMYIPRNPNGRIISVDYSGIENRLVAYIAGDKPRQQWLADPNYSEHKYLASILEGVPYEEVQKSKDKDSWYMIAKAVVHGSDRLIGSKKIWEKDDLDPEQVKKVHQKWKSLIADTCRWQTRIADEVKRLGVAVNPFGRKLWFWESNVAPEIISFFPQSTAFDVIARAMIGLMFERIEWPKDWAEKVCPISKPLPLGADLNLQVHDELVVETENAEVVPETIQTMKEVMEQPWPELKGLRLPVGVGAGPDGMGGLSWGEC